MRARYRTDDEVDDERFDVPSDPRGWTTTLAVTNPDHLEARYRDFLHDRIDESRQALEAKLLPAIDDMAEPLEARADGFRADISIAGILEHLLRMVELAGRVVRRALGSPEDRILSIGESVSEHNKGELAEDFGRIAKVQPEFADGHTDQRLREFARENLDLIQDVDRQPFDELSDELVQAVREGKRPEAIKGLVQERLDVTEGRAERIARDQVSKLNSDFNRVRQRNNGIERYEWMSAADRRVRKSHAFLHGQIRRWSNPHPTEGHPGDPINCRCVARGIVADLVSDDVRQAESKAPQFDVPDVRDRRYNYNPNWSTDDKARYVQNEWVHGSWNEEPTAMKQAAAREFGFDEDRVWNPRGHDPDDAMVDDMTDVVAHQYQKAQDELDRRGIDSVTLYRGLSSDVEEQGVLSSWTQSKEVAESFDDYIVKEEIPAERVLFFKGGPSWQDGKFGNQEEWVVLPEDPEEVGDDDSFPEASALGDDDTDVDTSTSTTSVPDDEDDDTDNVSPSTAGGAGDGDDSGGNTGSTVGGSGGDGGNGGDGGALTSFGSDPPFDPDEAGYPEFPNEVAPDEWDSDYQSEIEELVDTLAGRNDGTHPGGELQERSIAVLRALQHHAVEGDRIAQDGRLSELVSDLDITEETAEEIAGDDERSTEKVLEDLIRKTRGSLAELERSVWVAEERDDLDSPVHLGVQASEVEDADLEDIEAPDGNIDADVYYRTDDGTEDGLLHAEQVKSQPGTLANSAGTDSKQFMRLGEWEEPGAREARFVLGDTGDFSEALTDDANKALKRLNTQSAVLVVPLKSGGFEAITYDEFNRMEKAINEYFKTYDNPTEDAFATLLEARDTTDDVFDD